MHDVELNENTYLDVLINDVELIIFGQLESVFDENSFNQCILFFAARVLITPGIAHLFPNFPYWPDSQSIPGFDPYLTPYSNWNILKGFQPNDPKYYEFMEPIGLPKWVGVIINGIRVGNNGLLNTLLEYNE
ncbi:hypothetical protein T08_13596 [Trichinella sp. T8]|nr:hypothetical protein T08_13596 [Trichinella sp. T8]